LNHIINNRSNTKSGRNDLANVLMKELGGAQSTPEDNRLMIDEMKFMMSAGYFPISSTLSIFWHLIGRHPDYLIKIKKEIRDLPDDYKFTEHFYRNIPVTASAVFETMRLYPVAFSLWRKSKIECKIKGFVIPKGKAVCISLFNIHRNPKFWNDPNIFIPERFTEAESKNRPKHFFTPFGWGSRKCIGDHYAMMIIFLTIIKSLRKYEINILPGQKLEVKSIAIICPKKVLAKVSLREM